MHKLGYINKIPICSQHCFIKNIFKKVNRFILFVPHSKIVVEPWSAQHHIIREFQKCKWIKNQTDIKEVIDKNSSFLCQRH